MANPVGNLSHFGIGLENTAGTIVKNQVYLDFISETLQGKGRPIRSRAVTGSRFVKKAVMGPYEWSGDVVMEVTPDKVTKLLHAALASLSTAGTTAPYTHTLKPSATLLPFTAHVYRPGPDAVPEPCHFLYPGGYVEALEFRQNAESILELTATLAGRGTEVIYDAAQEDVGIAYSTIDPFVFHECQPSLGGSEIDITDNWRWRIGTGLMRKRNVSGGRGMNRAFPGDAMVSGAMELMFEDITQHRKWAGAAADTSPIAIGTTVDLQALQLQWTKTANQVLTLICTSGYFITSGPAVRGRDQMIIQPVEFEGLYNASDAADGYLTMKNAEPGATVSGLGTNI